MEPSREEIERYHALYIEGLKRVFEENKGKFGVPEEAHLNILG